MQNKFAIRRLLEEDPCELTTMKICDEQNRLLDVLSDLEEQIKNKFANDGGALDLFDRFKTALEDLSYEEMCTYFERGIRFGVKFGMELVED